MKVSLENVTKRYPNRDKKIKGEVTVVDKVSFELPDGELVGLLGPSGCGKSTILNMISGLTPVTEGKILFGDDDVTKLPPEHRGIGLVFQNYALYPHLTVLENIIFPLQNLKGSEKMTKEQMLARADEIAELVQIKDYYSRKPSELSGGQQQRVAIARALVKKPRVLLLDEPLSNLDARLRLQTREEIRRIQKETGVTTVFVTHDQEEAMSITDRMIVMNAGKIMQIDRPQTVYDDPANLFVAKFLGTPSINVFRARAEGGNIIIGQGTVMSGTSAPDGDITVAIRPEGFIIDENGPLESALERVEVMGRDISVISSNENSLTGVTRSIVDSSHLSKIGGSRVRFSVREGKIFLFDSESGERIRS